jgi:cell division septal protein FtsQ
MSPIAVSADRRFRRARAKPARRRGRLQQTAIVAAKTIVPVLVLLFAAVRGAEMISAAPRLQIDNLAVEGNHRMSRAEVVAALNGLVGTNILAADLDEWRARLEQAPWIREARFRRSFPSTVIVTVSEREPIGIARLKERLYLIDERGAIIDDYGPGYSDFDLPIVDGLASLPAERNAEGERMADTPRAELAARVIHALRSKPAIGRRLSQVDVSDVHNAAVIMNGDPALIYVGDDRFLPRLEAYFGLASALRERVPDIDYVDLRFDDRIYVRPTPGTRGRKTAAHITTGSGATAVPAASRGQR